MKFDHMQGAPILAGIITLAALALLGIIAIGFRGSVQIG